eukprot:jgi/Tetstr1/426522/TSEL_016820.t1
MSVQLAANRAALRVPPAMLAARRAPALMARPVAAAAAVRQVRSAAAIVGARVCRHGSGARLTGCKAAAGGGEGGEMSELQRTQANDQLLDLLLAAKSQQEVRPGRAGSGRAGPGRAGADESKGVLSSARTSRCVARDDDSS